MKDLKYFVAYTIPASAFLALYLQGIWSYSTVIYAFVFIPLLELILPRSRKNLSEEESQARLESKLYDWLLYLNLPIIVVLLVCYFQTIYHGTLSSSEVTGLTLSIGIVLGACGINVAHELGHRSTNGEQLLSKILLLPELYMHFFIEHNRGHHKNIATDLDPASAKYGEALPVFWIRSVIGSYISAWRLENERLRRAGLRVFSWQNEMWRFQIFQLMYLLTIFWIWDARTMMFAILIATVGFLLLETINYIEHYGLRRQKLPNGRYENVGVQHSWNANHEMGRIVLYELTRHSDHHYKSTRKYQILQHHNESPQLPFGYPASMLLAMIPPLWFGVMNGKVSAFKEIGIEKGYIEQK